jgi:DHA2 family multidrug resistance protein-like MFS transporter
VVATNMASVSADASTAALSPAAVSRAPARGPLVLGALILVATVANLNLSVANVALPEIGDHFDASQTGLDIVAVGYSLGLAASVLWLGALGDRYGRKRMLLLGTALAVPHGRPRSRCSPWHAWVVVWPPGWPTRPRWR